MTHVEILTEQTKNAYDWTNKLISSVPAEKWDAIPGVVESNITWQVGHLIVTCYFHSIMVIRGHQHDVLERVPLKVYGKLFTEGTMPRNVIGQVNRVELLNQFAFVQQKSIDVIRSLSDEELGMPLERTAFTHPIAKIKVEAVDWNIKHTMYHCGQIGLLKRILDRRYDFGFRMPG